MNNIITGIGSGLNINALVEAQVKAANAPKQSQINRQKIRLETSISTLGMFASGLHNWQNTINKLKNNGFQAFVAEVSDPKIADIKITEKAQNTNLKLEVSKLASGAKISSKLLANNYQTAKNGSLTLNLGTNSYQINIAAQSDLNQIAQEINQQLNQNGISANVANDASGARLLLSSNKTGANMALSVQGSQNLSDLTIDGTQMQEGDKSGVLVKASDAKFKLDGLKMTASNNHIQNVINGVNLELKEIGGANIGIQDNKSGVMQNVQEFVGNYNELVKLSNNLGADDISLRNLMNSLAKQVSSSLAQLGISTQKDGTLQMSPNNKINAAEISAIFNGKNGVLAQMQQISGNFSGDKNLLSAKQSSLNEQLQKLDLEQIELNQKSESLSAMLYRKFNAMDETVSKLNAIRQSISATFDAINNKHKS